MESHNVSIAALLALGVLLVVGAIWVGPAHAVELRDGEYLCSLSPTMQLGSIWIKGNSYVGPSRDPNGAPHSFEVTPSGTVNWSSPMGGMDTDGNHVVGTVIRDAGGGKTGFDIQFQTETGSMHVASCGPQF